ncbi:MAG: GSCFA domain-containing protein [Bacteroidales bacterium]
MKFRTEIKIPDYPFQIDFSDKIMLLGSCFSDHIGSFFETNQFQVLSNPFGTLFNPISIANALNLSLNPTLFNESLVDYFNGQWISYSHHGKFSHFDKTVFIQNIEQQLQQGHDFLLKTDFLFVTFGTAFCYRLIERDLIVANCHKIPAVKFEKIRLTIEHIVEIYRRLMDKLVKEKPTLKIIFTVSPVRHLGDGFHENQLSKSILHLAIDALVDDQHYFYFPSYEILQDDLRDYRFYAQDLSHPGENALLYIEEKVMEKFFSKFTLDKIAKQVKNNKLLNHRKLKI